MIIKWQTASEYWKSGIPMRLKRTEFYKMARRPALTIKKHILKKKESSLNKSVEIDEQN